MKTAADQIAQTILQQLGGQKFQSMTGAHNFVMGEAFLTFKLPKANRGINAITVALDLDDTYTLRFHRVRQFEAKLLCEVSGIHADALRQVFTTKTGLRTSL